MNFETSVTQTGSGLTAVGALPTATSGLNPYQSFSNTLLSTDWNPSISAPLQSEVFGDRTIMLTPSVSTQDSFTPQLTTQATLSTGSDSLLGHTQSTALTDDSGGDSLTRSRSQNRRAARATASSGQTIRIEAESLSSRSRYRVESAQVASGGKLISMAGAKNSQSGKAAGTFKGASGTYRVILGYYDENDGVAKVETRIGGKAIATTVFDQNLGSSIVESKTLVRRTISSAIAIKNGDAIEFRGNKNDGDCARVDYIEFVPVAAAVTPPPPPPAPPTPPTLPTGSVPKAPSNPIFSDAFSGSRSSRWETELGASHQFKVENNTARFELRKSDPLVASGKRAELKFKEADLSKGDFWYSFRMFLPTDYKYDTDPEIITQWHGPTSGQYSSPNLTIRTEEGKFKIEGAWFPPGSNVRTKAGVTRKLYWTGNYTTGQWIDWTFNVKFSANGDGVIQAWKDKQKVLDYKGQNTDGRKDFLMFKMGMYKNGWHTGKASTTTNRVIYFDDVNIWKG